VVIPNNGCSDQNVLTHEVTRGYAYRLISPTLSGLGMAGWSKHNLFAERRELVASKTIARVDQPLIKRDQWL